MIRYDQRGCGRSTGSGPFTITQAVDDLDQLRAAMGVDRWGVVGHSWGAELALRYAAAYPTQSSAVSYIAGVGADDAFLDQYVAERRRRLADDYPRWAELAKRARTPAEEREWSLLQWRPDFAPSSDAAGYAEDLWVTRPPGALINAQANHELWAARMTLPLLDLAPTINTPVTMIIGADDPRPWSCAEPLCAALPNCDLIVLDDAGHAPWVERPRDTQATLMRALDPD